MTALIEFLLGIDRINLSEGGPIHFALLASWPAWIVFLALVAGAVYVWSIYRREPAETPSGTRLLLVVLRCLVVFLALLLLLEPALVLERNDVIPSGVAVLLDTSESMAVRDALQTDGEAATREALQRAEVDDDGQPPARFDLARAALALDDGQPLRSVAADQRVYLYTFDETPQLLARIDEPETVDDVLATLRDIEPTGTRSAPLGSMERVLEQLAGQTMTGVVLISDGRSTVRGRVDRLKEIAEARGIPFFAVGVGSPEPPNDAEVLTVNAKRWAFVSEEPAVRVTLVNQGYEGRSAKLKLTVKDHPELSLTETVVLGAPGRPQPVELRLKPEVAGKYEIAVELSTLEGEFDEQNNSQLPIEIEVLERKPRVLLVEDLPRWEYQYLKNALYRDETIQVSILLLSADLQFAPEGDIPVRTFPSSREELFEYDVIVLGDVDRRMFSIEQLEWIDAFVREKGGGLVLIAGSRLLNPNTYGDTPIETLLPVVMSDEQLVGTVSQPWQPEITLEGGVSPILKFEDDPTENAAAWRALEPFFWYYQAKRAKPGAQVLLVHPDHDNLSSPDRTFPIMVIQSVGAGKVFFSSTDETWRWRYYTGRRYFNTFWLQLIRHMALPQDKARIETLRQRYALGDTARLTLRVTDRQNLSETVEEVRAAIAYTDPSGEAPPVTDEVVLQRTKPGSGVFEADFTPERTGAYTITCDVPLSAPSGGETSVRVESQFEVTPSFEERNEPTRDDTLLAAVAALSPESQRLAPLEMTTLASRIVNRSRIVSNDLTDEIWDSPLSLALFLGLISAEWIVRKKHRML